MPDTPATTTALRQQSVNRLDNDSQLGQQGWVATPRSPPAWRCSSCPRSAARALAGRGLLGLNGASPLGFAVSTHVRARIERRPALHGSRRGAFSAHPRRSSECRPRWPRSQPSAPWRCSPPSWRTATLRSSPPSCLLVTGACSLTASRSVPMPSRCCSRPSRAPLALDVRHPSRRALAGFVLASLALTYSNVMAVTLVLCMIASLFALPAGQRFWFRRGLAAAIVVGLTAPLALIISRHNEGGRHGIDVGTLWDVLMVLTGRSGLVGIVGVAILGIVALRATVRVFRRERAPLSAGCTPSACSGSSVPFCWPWCSPSPSRQCSAVAT